MKKYLRIFLLNFERIMEHRVRSLVWFLVSLFNPLLYILYWRGAFQGRDEIIPSWTMSSMTAYFFLLTIIASTLMAHIEQDVSERDIQEGQLVQYLMKPFPYFLLKLFEEFHYRLLQGSYGLIILTIFTIVVGPFVSITQDPSRLFFAVAISVLAYFLAFTFKMVIGLIAFWTTDIWGVFFFVDIIMLIFAGYIVPIDFLIKPLNTIAHILPFSYMIYFPVIAFQGKLDFFQIIQVLGYQSIWLFIFMIIYKFLWKKGIKEFSGVGQ